ncbi:LCP family protein [Natronoglycomyces albus]|uniref:LCP family protein n=1 Tax=Natronoglycomyces albus TaxID=2811108 RepID=A0A895XNA7_9ACTN|nr:LCP family protein [Natronoglycomyces albus]QSB05023.1 LCP family protein [Natronoglycomyces albus]
MSTSASKHRKEASTRRSPWWAHAMVVFGAMVMVISGGAAVVGQVAINTVNHSVGSEDLLGEDRLEIGSNVEGPLNFLILGVDQRVQSDKPGMANAIMIFHIDEDLENAYLTSIPRDLYVSIPDCGPAWNHNRCDNKINHSSSISLDLATGFANTSSTVTELTGVRFHGGAIINFEGFLDLIDELGTIELCLEQDITSIHGDRNFYPEGCGRYNQEQALDLVRQRYQYADGDYGRQRMQQEALKQILVEARNQGYHTNPGKIGTLVEGIGEQVTVDFGDTSLTDLVVALRHIDPESFQTMTVPSEPWDYAGTSYVRTMEGEQEIAAQALYEAIRNDRLDEWVAQHPEWTNNDDSDDEDESDDELADGGQGAGEG